MKKENTRDNCKNKKKCGKDGIREKGVIMEEDIKTVGKTNRGRKERKKCRKETNE